jgi:hypothetical protein
MQLLRVKTLDGRACAVNPAQIIYIDDQGSSCDVYFSGGHWIHVDEPFPDLLRRLQPI